MSHGSIDFSRLNATQLETLRWLNGMPPVIPGDVAAAFAISERAAEARLDRLVSKGVALSRASRYYGRQFWISKLGKIYVEETTSASL